jgi:hypothetical protein
LKIFSRSPFALNLLIEFSYGAQANHQNPTPIPHKRSRFNHNLFLYFVCTFKTMLLHQRPLRTIYNII